MSNTEQPTPTRRWRDAITREEIQQLCAMSDVRTLWSIVVNWSVVFGSMALVHVYPNPLTVLLAVVLIGTRQLGLAIFMHDASHHALLSNRRLNDWVGNWIGAYPVWSDMDSYRPYHLQHHNHNWTERDPDLKLASPFPITAASFRRKVVRDLTGQTGLKFLVFALRRDFGTEGGPFTRLGRALRSKSFRGMLITNGILCALCAALGHAGLYLLWVVAYFTTYTLVTRIRSIAEHSMAPEPGDELLNTRTTVASWWERLLIAPNRVNYHLEHHLLMTVPHYHLPRFHRLLRERGVLDRALVADGYVGVLKDACSAAPRAPRQATS